MGRLAKQERSRVRSSIQVDTEALVLDHRTRARKIAYRMLAKWGCTIDHFEVESLVDLALCEAANHYKPTGSACFLSYAHFFIKGNLIRWITAETKRSKRFTSICNENNEDIEHVSDALADEESCPEVAVERAELREHCRAALDSLPEIEREVVTSTFLGEEKMPVLARRWRMSRGYLFEVRNRASHKLQRELCDFRMAA